MPTPDDILARDRRRPIGAVLVDVCHDLGIALGLMDRATWDELFHYIVGYGGSLATLLFKRPGPAGQEPPGVFRGYFTGPFPTATGRPVLALPAWPAPQ